MRLPDGVQQLTTVEEVEAAWGDLFILQLEEGEDAEKVVAFAGNSRVVIAADAVYVQLRKPIMAGSPMELTDVVRIHEPTVGEIRLTDKYKGEVEKSICLLTAICGIPGAEVNKMAASDMRLCGEVMQGFM